MQYVRLGSSGLKVSRLCLGAMTYGDPKWRAWVLPEDAAVRSSSERSSTASTSSIRPTCIRSGASEEVLGRALRDFAQRDDVVIATKVFNPMSDGPNDRRAVAQAHHDVDRSSR